MNAQTQTSPDSFWRNMGNALCKGGVRTGGWLEKRYRSIAPELRTHLGEASLLSITLLASRKTPTEILQDDGHRLIVFVHGLAGHRGNFLPMQKYFGWLGRTRTVSIGFPNTESMEVMADYLRETLIRLVKENNLPSEKGVDIVTHSMGGIITRLALEDPQIASQVHTFITLATPHKGTQLARYLDTHKIKELRPSSSLLQRLDCQLPWGRHAQMPRLICFWTPKDMILLPPRHAIAQGAEEICVPESSHLGFLLQRSVWEKIFKILGSNH